MPIRISRWERYPGTDRNELAAAALAFCRATRTVDGVRSRFYWIDTNELIVVNEAESPEAMNALSLPGSSERAKAAFDLGDLAKRTEVFTAAEPRSGAEAHAAAGRSNV